LAVAGKSSSVSHAQHFEDCPFCLTQGDTGLLRQDSGASLFAISGSHQFPLLSYQAHRPFFVWATPQSALLPFNPDVFS
jgi:hypothetical protein